MRTNTNRTPFLACHVSQVEVPPGESQDDFRKDLERAMAGAVAMGAAWDQIALVSYTRMVSNSQPLGIKNDEKIVMSWSIPLDNKPRKGQVKQFHVVMLKFDSTRRYCFFQHRDGDDQAMLMQFNEKAKRAAERGYDQFMILYPDMLQSAEDAAAGIDDRYDAFETLDTFNETGTSRYCLLAIPPRDKALDRVPVNVLRFATAPTKA